MHGPASAADPWSARGPRSPALFHPRAAVVSGDRILRIQGYSDLTRVRPAIRRAADAMAAIAGSDERPVRGLPPRADRGQSPAGARGRRRPRAALPGLPARAGRLHRGRPVRPHRGGAARPAGRGARGRGRPARGGAAGERRVGCASRMRRGSSRSACARPRLRRDRRITSRLGPGYSYKIDDETCDWPLEEQRALFALLGRRSPPGLAHVQLRDAAEAFAIGHVRDRTARRRAGAGERISHSITGAVSMKIAGDGLIIIGENFNATRKIKITSPRVVQQDGKVGHRLHGPRRQQARAGRDESHSRGAEQAPGLQHPAHRRGLPAEGHELHPLGDQEPGAARGAHHRPVRRRDERLPGGALRVDGVAGEDGPGDHRLDPVASTPRIRRRSAPAWRRTTARRAARRSTP